MCAEDGERLVSVRWQLLDVVGNTQGRAGSRTGSPILSCSPLRVGGRRSTAGPADLNDFVLYPAVITTEKPRDLLYREAAH
jgi:hypothetical protein